MFNSNEVINGLYGHVYDENGQEQSSTQEFEANVTFDKKQFKIAGKLMAGNKVMGAKGDGSMKFLKVDSRLQKKILTDPTAKYNYVGKLADPTAKGEEAVLLIGVSFDGAPLTNYKLGDEVEVDLKFTFDDYRYINDIE